MRECHDGDEQRRDGDDPWDGQTLHLNSALSPVYCRRMSASRKTVLVIDSQDDARERLSQTLRRDYRVIRASSAEAGLALMDREDVDVLVADVQQSGLGGLDLLQIVRENFPLIEIIMTSAAADVDGAVKAIKLGAYHFLTKDADPDVLRALVRRSEERRVGKECRCRWSAGH